jgi:hypothetical protein
MAKTTNLGLNLTEDDQTTFKTWRESLDGNGADESLSNMQIIDDFAGKIYGQSGTFTLTASGWSGNDYTIAVEELGENDALLVSGATASDQTKMGTANLFATASAGSVTFTAETKPTEDITLNYFIARGK